MIAHYTSVEGFIKIMEKDSLRMTRSEFMNDPSDSKVMGSMIREYLAKSNVEKKVVSSEIKSIYEKATVSEYIEYIQNKIHLFVLSFTDKIDEMVFWNYYGNGGVQLGLDEELLLENIAKPLKSENEYIACSKVIYVNEKDSLENIYLDQSLEEFVLRGKGNVKVFEEHIASLSPSNRQLYEINNVKKFVDFFVNDYVKTIEHLVNIKKVLSHDSSTEEIFREVFKNQNDANCSMIFKKDFLIYMILLSTLVKTNSYEYENETRIVYFENTLNEIKTKDIEFESKTISGQSYLRPYMKFEKVGMSTVLDEIIASPLTRNVPIDNVLYQEVLCDYLKKNGIENKKVSISRHKSRW